MIRSKLIIGGIVILVVFFGGLTVVLFGKATQYQHNAALIAAVKAADIASAEALLNRGADVETRNHEDWDKTHWHEEDFTPLALAVAREDAPMVRMLLAHGANVHAKTEGNGFPPYDLILNNAAKSNDVAIARLLIERGASVNVGYISNVTPLMMAAEFNRPQMVAFLIQNGADVHAVDDRGFTALHCASERSHHDKSAVIRLLKNAGARF